MTRAALILSVYNRAVYAYTVLANLYSDLASAGNLTAADSLAPIVRRRAAAVEATIAECTPEASE